MMKVKPPAHLLLLSALIAMGLSSCESSKSKGSSDYASNYPADGAYNPYPDGGGGQVHHDSLLPSSGGLVSSQYGQRVPPPPPGFSGPSSSSSERKPSSSSPRPSTASTTKPAPPKKPVSAPSKAVTKSTSKPAPKAAPKSSGGGSYTVVQGDTLWSISRKKNTTVEKLKSLNGLSSDKLKIGLKLKLP